MIIDNLLYLADAQAETTSNPTTSHVDTLAKGSAYVAPWVVFRIDTAVTSGGSLGLTAFEIQDSANGDFYDGTTVAAVSNLAPASLTAGKFFKFRLPPGCRRYIRGYVRQTVMPWTAGKFDCFIAEDVDLPVNLNAQ